ncbi:MAG: glycosyltransferase family 4 protein [Anaerolineaceae bacterium]|nr:glycosyltransferase family 4 protein [Anaerolineaceae bacterium]
MIKSQARVGVVQRVMPSYRVSLFDALAGEFSGNVSVFAGEPRKSEALAHSAVPQTAKIWRGKNYHLFNGSFYLCWQSGLMEWLADWQPHILIMEANPRYLHSNAAMRWMRKEGGKLIGWGLGSPDVQGTLALLRMSFRKNFVHKFDALITYSSQGAREYEALGFPSDCIFIAPNAAAPKPVHPMPERRSVFRGDKPIVVFVGRLQERKRVRTLIHACAVLPPDIQPLLWVIGDGPQRTALENLAGEIYPQTQFYGAQYGSGLGEYLKSADLFVMPGTGGLAVQEAMSYGLPVIVGAADGTQGDLVRAENGWLLADDSIQTLKDTLASALFDISELRRKGASSYRIVSEEINLEKMVAAFVRAIEKVLED